MSDNDLERNRLRFKAKQRAYRELARMHPLDFVKLYREKAAELGIVIRDYGGVPYIPETSAGINESNLEDLELLMIMCKHDPGCNCRFCEEHTARLNNKDNGQ